jgi:hypothetical protein
MTNSRYDLDLDAIEARAKAALDIEASAADVPALVARVRELEMLLDSDQIDVETAESLVDSARARVRELEAEVSVERSGCERAMAMMASASEATKLIGEGLEIQNARVRELEAEVSRVSLRLSMMCDSHDTLERERDAALRVLAGLGAAKVLGR